MDPRADSPRARLDPRMRTSLTAVALSGVVLAVGALAVFGAFSAFSVALGAALATANLWALSRIVTALLPNENVGAGEPGPSRGAWALVALLKMFGLLGAAWLLMRYGVVAPVPMLAGFGSLPIGIAIASVVSDRGAVTPNC